ncbi:Uncharacterized protein QTN25_008132 [Entamoeba marina]
MRRQYRNYSNNQQFTNPVSSDDLCGFMEITASDEETAQQYLMQFDIGTAIQRFFDNPIKIIKKNGDGEEILLRTFDKHKVNEVLSDDQFTKFCKELNIPEEGYYSYLLSFLGNTKEFTIFKKEHITNINKELHPSKDIVKDLDHYFNNEIPKKRRMFMNFIHNMLKIMVVNANKVQVNLTEKQLNKSFCDRKEGRVEFIDFVEDVLNDILPSTMIQTPVNEVFWNYVKNQKKRLSISKDEFSYLPDFLKEFTTSNSLKLSKDDIESKVYLPILYTSFLEWVNKIN